MDIFCLISELRVNLYKSIILGINMEEERLTSLAGVFGCAIGSWLVKYSGLSFGGNPLQPAFWEPVVCPVKYSVQ